MRVVIIEGGRTYWLDAIVAATPQTREDGLSGFHYLAMDQGMLFVFPRDTIASFQTDGMRFPIDVVFLDRDGDVIRVVHDAHPCETCRIESPVPYRYALELPGGWWRARGLTEGAGVAWPAQELPVST